MGWSKGGGILNAVVENSKQLEVPWRKQLLAEVVEQITDLDYDEIGEHYGEDPLLDEVLVEGGYVNRATGKHTIKFWPYVDRWSLLEFLHDDGQVSNSDDDTDWLRCKEDYELTLDIDFDNQTAMCTHFMGVKLPEPVSILA